MLATVVNPNIASAPLGATGTSVLVIPVLTFVRLLEIVKTITEKNVMELR